MAETYKGSIRFGDVHSSRGDGYVSIELDDENSGIAFLQIKLTHEEFGRLVGTNGSVECSYEVRGKEKIGKKHERKNGSIQMSAEEFRRVTDGKYDTEHKNLVAWLLENAKEEGWEISPYLGSRGSIIGSGHNDEPVTLNFHYYRYV